MKVFRRTTLSLAAAQVAMMWAGHALAQATPEKEKEKAPEKVETIVVTGQRAALQSAQKIKQEADEIVDSIVADDIGKLPDRSVTEVLQRIVGVTMDRTAARSDPVHYSVEGSGVVIRGLTYVAAQLNGRETISANNGRGLGFEDVPPELMSRVDVYKNPSAEQTEGAIAGLVDLRTALPFDYKGFKGALSISSTYSDLTGRFKPEVSGLVANTWDTEFGKFGVLVDLAHSEGTSRTDTITVDPYYPTTTTTDGVTVATGNWFPRDLAWRSQEYDRKRDGAYAALQWKKDNMESSLTYFQSRYKFDMSEWAVKAEVDPYSILVEDATWDANGRLLKGVLRSNADGIEVENNTRFSSRTSQSDDWAWNFRWKPAPEWTLTSDVQYMTSKTHSMDSNVATGVLMPKQTIDLTGSIPKVSFDASDTEFLANQNNYYWATTMEHLDKGEATQKAWKGDVRYQFQNNPYLTDIRFGVRLADRDALTVNSNPNYNWAAVTKAWERFWYVRDLAWVRNYDEATQFNPFSNFMGGKGSVPGMYFPGASVVNGFPASYVSLHDHVKSLCTGWDWGGDDHCGWMGSNANPYTWAPATLGENPAGTNDQHERTTAGYTQLRFAFDDLPMPIDGNVGVRVVHTKSQANGYTTFTAAAVPDGAGGVTVPPFTSFAVPETFDNSYTNVLPSLNLRMKVGNTLQFRLAAAKAIARPELSRMQGTLDMKQNVEIDNTTSPVTVKSVTYTGTAGGNPMLKPVRSTQEDLTAEWYFAKSGSLTFAVFNKDLKDIIVDQTYVRSATADDGTQHNFIITAPVNGAKGHARGFEVAYQHYYDNLPDWLQGLGIQANYTYVDSKMKRYNAVYSEYCSAGAGADNLNLYINGCDTDGRSFGDMPLPNLSRNSFNLALLFDKGPVSARLAYSWREKYLQGVALNSDNTGPNQQNGLDTNPDSSTYGSHTLPLGLPLWGDDYGQLDAGIQYRFDDNLTLSLEGRNLTDSMYKQLMQQHIGTFGHNYFTSGRSYTVSLRYTF
jgi:iron complex outermembrane receptor protein